MVATLWSFIIWKGIIALSVCDLVSNSQVYTILTLSIGSDVDPGLGQEGGPPSEAESCQCNRAELCERSELFVAGVQGLFKGPGSFW